MRLTKTFTVEIDVECTYDVIHDPSYGSDADGNRGIPMDFIEDLNFNEKQVLQAVEEQLLKQAEDADVE